MLVSFQFRFSFGLQPETRYRLFAQLALQVAFRLLLTDCLPSSHSIDYQKELATAYLRLFNLSTTPPF